jgi:hypothetical protein
MTLLRSCLCFLRAVFRRRRRRARAPEREIRDLLRGVTVAGAPGAVRPMTLDELEEWESSRSEREHDDGWLSRPRSRAARLARHQRRAQHRLEHSARRFS